MRNPAAEWERFGRSDPYFGVFTSPDFRGELDDVTRERFFDSGRVEVERALVWVRAAQPEWAGTTALDYGCGVGRLSLALAAQFERVLSVDVSPSMLELTRRNATAAGVENLECHPADALAGLAGRYDLVLSRIVFQHIPRRRGERTFATLVSGLRPGGVGTIHVAVAPPNRRAALYSSAIRCLPFAAEAVNLVRRRPPGYPTLQMYTYRLDRLAAILAAQGITGWRADWEPGDGRRAYDSVTLTFRKPPASGS
jgi:SAM-dependent methyltransferase